MTLTSVSDCNLRMAAKRRGLILRKGRCSKYTTDFYGSFDGYQIISAINGMIIEGYYFELSAEDVREKLNKIDVL